MRLGFAPKGREIFTAVGMLDHLRVGCVTRDDRLAQNVIDEMLELFPHLTLPAASRLADALLGLVL